MSDLHSFIVYNAEQDLHEVKRFTINTFVKDMLSVKLGEMDGVRVVSSRRVYMKFPFLFCIEPCASMCESDVTVLSYIEKLYTPPVPITPEPHRDDVLKESFLAMKKAVDEGKRREEEKIEKELERKKKKPQESWDQIVKDIFDDWKQFDEYERNRWPRKYPYGY